MPDPTPAAVSSPPPTALRIERGACWVFFAFDVGHGIDLDAAQAALARSRPTRESLSGDRRTPPSLHFQPTPVQTVEDAAPVRVGRLETAPTVQCTLFDFGAVTIAFRIPLAGSSLDDLVHLAGEIYESRTLQESARERARGLLGTLGTAVNMPGLVDLVEDYVVFHAESWAVDGEPAGALTSSSLLAFAPSLAAVLRAADEPLSDDEIADAMASRLSYGRSDLTIIDWNAAVVFDARAQDTLTILEFGNVELLEMRFLDDRLDAVLDHAYRSVSRRPRLRANRDERRRLAALQMDSTLLFESINNAVKLVGDQYLARLYRRMARRFHLDEWDESVMRKLETVQRLYEKLADEQSTRRMELLEWIIILLIAVGLVLPFIPGLAH